MGFEISSHGRYVNAGQLDKFSFIEPFSPVLFHEFQNSVQPLRQDIRIFFRLTPFTSSQTCGNGFLARGIEDHILQLWLLGFARGQTVNPG